MLINLMAIRRDGMAGPCGLCLSAVVGCLRVAGADATSSFPLRTCGVPCMHMVLADYTEKSPLARASCM